jgi:polyhydroxyalkanoate synthesis regulator phasin
VHLDQVDQDMAKSTPKQTHGYGANPQHLCNTGILLLRDGPALAVKDGDLVERGEFKWQAKALSSGLKLTLLVSKGNKEEQAQARRLHLENEVTHRKLEAGALDIQIHNLTRQLAQVTTTYPHSYSNHKIHHDTVHYLSLMTTTFITISVWRCRAS